LDKQGDSLRRLIKGLDRDNDFVSRLLKAGLQRFYDVRLERLEKQKQNLPGELFVIQQELHNQTQDYLEKSTETLILIDQWERLVRLNGLLKELIKNLDGVDRVTRVGDLDVTGFHSMFNFSFSKYGLEQEMKMLDEFWSLAQDLPELRPLVTKIMFNTEMRDDSRQYLLVMSYIFSRPLSEILSVYGIELSEDQLKMMAGYFQELTDRRQTLLELSLQDDQYQPELRAKMQDLVSEFNRVLSFVEVGVRDKDKDVVEFAIKYPQLSQFGLQYYQQYPTEWKALIKTILQENNLSQELVLSMFGSINKYNQSAITYISNYFPLQFQIYSLNRLLFNTVVPKLDKVKEYVFKKENISEIEPFIIFRDAFLSNYFSSWEVNDYLLLAAKEIDVGFGNFVSEVYNLISDTGQWTRSEVIELLFKGFYLDPEISVLFDILTLKTIVDKLNSFGFQGIVVGKLISSLVKEYKDLDKFKAQIFAVLDSEYVKKYVESDSSATRKDQFIRKFIELLSEESNLTVQSWELLWRTLVTDPEIVLHKRFNLYFSRANQVGIFQGNDLEKQRKDLIEIVKETDLAYKEFEYKITHSLPIDSQDYDFYDYFLLSLDKGYLSDDDRNRESGGNYSRVTTALGVTTNGKSRGQVLEEVDHLIPSIEFKPFTGKFEFEAAEIVFTPSLETETELKSLIARVINKYDSVGEVMDEAIKAKMPQINKQMLEDLSSEDVTKRNLAEQHFVEEFNVPIGVVTANQKPEDKIENIQNLIYKSLLSDEEIDYLISLFFKQIGEDELRRYAEVVGFDNIAPMPLTDQEKAVLFEKLSEPNAVLGELLLSRSITEVMVAVTKSPAWKVFNRLADQRVKTESLAKANRNEVELVMARRNLLDLWQGQVSGTCFGGNPHYLAKNDNLITMRILYNGEIRGNVLFSIQGNKMIMIGFDPSVSLTSGLSEAKQKEFVDIVMSYIYKAAQLNDWQFLIAEPGNVGGISNRGAIGNYIISNYISDKAVEVTKEGPYCPCSGYVLKKAYQLPDKKIAELERAAEDLGAKNESFGATEADYHIDLTPPTMGLGLVPVQLLVEVGQKVVKFFQDKVLSVFQTKDIETQKAKDLEIIGQKANWLTRGLKVIFLPIHYLGRLPGVKQYIQFVKGGVRNYVDWGSEDLLFKNDTFSAGVIGSLLSSTLYNSVMAVTAFSIVASPTWMLALGGSENFLGFRPRYWMDDFPSLAGESFVYLSFMKFFGTFVNMVSEKLGFYAVINTSLDFWSSLITGFLTYFYWSGEELGWWVMGEGVASPTNVPRYALGLITGLVSSFEKIKYIPYGRFSVINSRILWENKRLLKNESISDKERMVRLAKIVGKKLSDVRQLIVLDNKVRRFFEDYGLVDLSYSQQDKDVLDRSFDEALMIIDELPELHVEALLSQDGDKQQLVEKMWADYRLRIALLSHSFPYNVRSARDRVFYDSQWQTIQNGELEYLPSGEIPKIDPWAIRLVIKFSEFYDKNFRKRRTQTDEVELNVEQEAEIKQTSVVEESSITLTGEVMLKLKIAPKTVSVRLADSAEEIVIKVPQVEGKVWEARDFLGLVEDELDKRGGDTRGNVAVKWLDYDRQWQITIIPFEYTRQLGSFEQPAMEQLN